MTDIRRTTKKVKLDKGFFANEAAILAAYPNGIATPTLRNGWYCINGDTDTVWVWDADTNAWVDTACNGLVTSVFSRTGAVAAQSNDYTWAQINKGTSDIADITTKSHTSLTDKGTNTHAQIDTHIAATGPHTGTYLLDGSRTLTGNMNAGDKNIIGLGSVGYTQELDLGSKTASFSVDFSTDQKQKATLTADSMTITFDTTNTKVGNYVFKIVNGGLATITWAAESGNVKSTGGVAPSLTSSGTDLLWVYYDGTDFTIGLTPDIRTIT